MNDMDTALAKAITSCSLASWSDADTYARIVIREDPANAPALFVMASVYSDIGDEFEAIRLWRASVVSDPKFVAGYRMLARSYYSLGRFEDAARVYSEWLCADPLDPEVLHMTAAASGLDVPDQCSADYVKAHFDQFASRFDNVLVNRLAYIGPRVISNALAKYVDPENWGKLNVVDLGCGTGLCGSAIRSCCNRLVGVDLSIHMVELARARDCYDELFVSDIDEFMASRRDTYDVIVACDVLIYFGSLERVITHVRGALVRGGIFIFTVEALRGATSETFKVQASGRYCHGEEYIRKTMLRARFEIRCLELVLLRWELGRQVECYLVVGACL